MSADTDPDRGAFVAGMSEAEYARRHQNPTPHGRMGPGPMQPKLSDESRARAFEKAVEARPHVTCEDSNVEALREDFLQRAQHGLLKYGVTTDREDLDLDAWLQHALEESMDFCVYLKRAIRERAMRMDLDQIFLRQIDEAVKASTWIPPEYTANDWQADVIQLLRYGPGNVSLPEIYHTGGVVPKSDTPVPALLGREREYVLPVKLDASEVKAALDETLKKLHFKVSDIHPSLLTMLRQSARFDDNSAFNATLQHILDALLVSGGSDAETPAKIPDTTYWYRVRDDAFPLQQVWSEWKQCDYTTFIRYLDDEDDEDADVEVKTEPAEVKQAVLRALRTPKKPKAKPGSQIFLPTPGSKWQRRQGGEIVRVVETESNETVSTVTYTTDLGLTAIMVAEDFNRLFDFESLS